MMNPNDEMFEVYDAAGRCLGLAPRRECHGNPALIHRSVHVVIRHPAGRILLQKRSAAKDIQPGRWDTAVGGHLSPGEDWETAARRELGEELGVTAPLELRHLFDMKVRNAIESEDIRVFGAVSEGPFRLQEEEVDEVRFWRLPELEQPAVQDLLTPLLKQELELLRDTGR
jgi:isopentenyldiphosphate isomerase